MGGQIIQDEDIPRPKARGEFLTDVFPEEFTVEFTVEGTVDDHRGEQTAQADGDDEGGGFPRAVRDGIDHPLGRRPQP